MQAPSDTQEDSEAVDVCSLIFSLHTPSQAGQKAQHSQAGAWPLKPIRGVLAVTKQHNEIRQEEWGDGEEDPAALCYRHKILGTTHNKSKVWMGGRACFEFRAQDNFFYLQDSRLVCCSPDHSDSQAVKGSSRRPEHSIWVSIAEVPTLRQEEIAATTEIRLLFERGTKGF